MGTLATRYHGLFTITACVLVAYRLIIWSTSQRPAVQSKQGAAKSAQFAEWQRGYLIIFLLAAVSDWLQGPYVYELYVSYGFSEKAIAELFVCGFGSSLVFGTMLGGVADKMGRKRVCLLYCILYTCGCVTKNFNNYGILMMGRIFSGASLSILYSIFESWVVADHQKRGFALDSLGNLFAVASFGNSAAAIVAGVVANYAANIWGYVAPFVVAIIPLLLCFVLILFMWDENYGDSSTGFMSSVIEGYGIVRRDERLAALGLGQSCFEGAMYSFVFMWTPALKAEAEVEWFRTHPHRDGRSGKDSVAIAELNGSTELTADFLGIIFATFMVCSMIGASLYERYQKEFLHVIPVVFHSAGVITMGMTALFLDNKLVVYIMFLVFEVSIGAFFPAYGTIKATKVPEESRSAIMNLFRVPMNAFVILLLINIESLSYIAIFVVCTLVHIIGLLSYLYFWWSISKLPDKEESEQASSILGDLKL